MRTTVRWAAWCSWAGGWNRRRMVLGDDAVVHGRDEDGREVRKDDADVGRGKAGLLPVSDPGLEHRRPQRAELVMAEVRQDVQPYSEFDGHVRSGITGERGEALLGERLQRDLAGAGVEVGAFVEVVYRDNCATTARPSSPASTSRARSTLQASHRCPSISAVHAATNFPASACGTTTRTGSSNRVIVNSPPTAANPGASTGWTRPSKGPKSVPELHRCRTARAANLGSGAARPTVGKR